jgi:tetratricopeptide (TPR) repeat protein
MVADTQLDTLEAKGLIRLATYRPELEYLFRHWLVQDAAYGSLLKQERKELHRQVGEALEVLYPDRRGELAGMLAIHFEQAGETAKAIEYLIAAGTYGLERSAIQEAFGSFDRAAGLLPPASPNDSETVRRQRVLVQVGRARAGWSFRSGEATVEDLDSILPEVERLGDLEQEALIHTLVGLTRLQRGENAADPAVRKSLDRVTEIARQLKDPSLQAMPLALVGLGQVFGGPIRAGVAALEEAVPLMEQRKDTIGASFARGALAIGYANLGEFDKAEAAAKNASEIAATSDLIAQLDAQIAESWVRAARGQLDQAVPLAQACINRAEETGASACVLASSWILGDALHRQGKFAEARDVLQRGTEISQVVDRKGWRPTLTAWLGSATAALGDPDRSDWAEALETARSIGSHLGEAGILSKRAETLARSGQIDAALSDFAGAAAILENEGARPSLARLLQSWGQVLQVAGRSEEAHATLQRSLALFEELGLEAEAKIVGTMLSLGPTKIAFA